MIDKIPPALQLGNFVLGAVDGMDLKRLEDRITKYDLLIAELEAFLVAPPPSSLPSVPTDDLWYQKGVELAAKARQGLYALVPGSVKKTPTVDGGDKSAEDKGASAILRLRADLTELLSRTMFLREKEREKTDALRVQGGLSKLNDPTQMGGLSFGYYLSLAMLGACTYHGYRRNQKVSSALLWGAAPFFGGFVGGSIALAVAMAQGFGKPKQ